MSEQDLYQADVDSLLQESGRKTVAKRVGYETLIETADRPCRVEGPAGHRTGKMSGALAVGEEPLPAAMVTVHGVENPTE